MADPQYEALATFDRLIDQATRTGNEAAAADLSARRDAILMGMHAQPPPQEAYRSEPMPLPQAPPPESPPPVLPPSSMGAARAAPVQAIQPPPPQAPPPQAPPPAVAPQRGFSRAERLTPVEPWGPTVVQAAHATARGVPFIGDWTDEAAAKVGELAGQGTYADNVKAIRQSAADFDKKNPYTSLGLQLAGGVGSTVAAAPALAAAAGVSRLGTLAQYLLGTGARTIPGSVARGAVSAGAEAGASSLERDRNKDIGWLDYLKRSGEAALKGAGIGGSIPLVGGGMRMGYDRVREAITGAPRLTPARVETVPQLEAREARAYSNPVYTDAAISVPRGEQLVGDVAATMQAPRINFPTTLANLQHMIPPPRAVPGLPQQADIPLLDVEATRRRMNLGNPATETEGKRTVRQGIDNFYDNLTQADLVRGQAANVADILREGRRAHSGAESSKTIQERLVRQPLDTTGATHSAQNLDNEVRKAARSLRRDVREDRWATPAEREQMQEIARGTPDRNLGRAVGKLFPSEGLGGLAAMTVAPAGIGWAADQLGMKEPWLTIPATMAVLGGAAGARRLASSGTQRSVDLLDAMVRARGMGPGMQEELMRNIARDRELARILGMTGAAVGGNLGDRR